MRRLRKLAPTAERMAGLPEETIARAIYPAAFFRVKARRLKALAGIVCRRHGGEVPARMESLLALPGVGRKTANLTLSLGFGKAAVCVDAHVHRILNRLGALATGSPEATESWLRARLPRRKWSGINSVLVPFGQNLCTPRSPRCSRCPAAEFCLRVGVARSR